MKWEKVTLRQIATDMPTSYGDEEHSFNEKCEVVKVSNVSSSGRLHGKFELRSFKPNELQRLLVESGDLLVVKSSGSKTNILSGKTALVKDGERYVASNFLMRLKPNQHRIDPRYLWYFLNSRAVKEFIVKIVGATTYPNIKFTDYGDLQVPLPPLPVQKQIADTLDKADALQQKDQQLLCKYDELAQAVFYNMFGDLETNGRHFEKVSLGELINIPNKLVDPREEPFCRLLHVGGDNIESNTGKISNLKRAGELGLKSGKFLFNENSILYNKIRPYLNKVGLPNFEGVCSADMYPIVPNERVNKLFLYFVLRSKDFVSFASNQSRRANIPKINREELSQYQCMVPPLFLQNEFSAALSNIRCQVEVAELQQGASTHIFSSLLESFFVN